MARKARHGGDDHREEEEFSLLYGPRKERKAIKKRRKAEKAAKEKIALVSPVG